MARIKATFRAGDMVTVREDAFRVNYDDTVEDTVSANFHVTREDTDRWYADKRKANEEASAKGEDTFDINLDSGGESRLPPRGGYTPLIRGTAYRVLRARCRESFSYYNPTGGWTKLLDLATGREVFYKMDKLEKVVA
ncbi:MAG TPA: hypothetical protein EYQ00_05300 [Dehalococcoidia bacterium]|nr:hypothetical protein [Dehalococcoidia bacterium]